MTNPQIMTIKKVHAWQALDSRGTPTVGCRVDLEGGGSGRVIAPSGASTGSREAREVRDGGPRWAGRGVSTAVKSLMSVLGPGVVGLQADDQICLDARIEAIDGTDDLGRLGANAAVALSLACLVAQANQQGLPLFATLDTHIPPLLPRPMVNIISGGAHAGRLVSIQDVLVMPLLATTVHEAIEVASRVRSATSAIMEGLGLQTALVADEGGLAGHFASSESAIHTVVAAIEAAGLQPGVDAAIALDIAATQFCTADGYLFDGEHLGATELVDTFMKWLDIYPIISLEDPLGENDVEGWALAGKLLGPRIQLLADDLTCTNASKVHEVAGSKSANALLVKVNQAGTVTRAFNAMRASKEEGWANVVSARSGDTEDDWLADLAIGWRADQIKVGSTMRSERTAKWNRLLEIETLYPGAIIAPFSIDRPIVIKKDSR